jgi:nitrate reductase delta subunit
MNTTLKALGALLTYPNTALRAALPEIAAALQAERALRRSDKLALHALIDELLAGEPLEVEEGYVSLFDRGRQTSLNLFEHVHGDSRDRGPAMVDLKQTYERAGFLVVSSELPDYLPMLLEFLSTRSTAEVREMLADCAYILRTLGEGLRDRESRYAAVFAALLSVAGEPGFAPERRVEPVPERSLDEEWLDAEVVFGPGAARDCGTAAGAAAGSAIQPLHFMPKTQ